MKSKKLPRSVKAFLLLLGFFGGSLISMILMAISTIIPLAIVALLGLFVVALLSFYIIGWRYRKTLEAWNLIEPKKEKKK